MHPAEINLRSGPALALLLFSLSGSLVSFRFAFRINGFTKRNESKIERDDEIPANGYEGGRPVVGDARGY